MDQNTVPDCPTQIDSVAHSEGQTQTTATWVRWTTKWATVDGRHVLVWLPQYGGPMDSPLTKIGASLSRAGRLDPTLL